MCERIEVEWTYSPEDLFEEESLLVFGEYGCRVANGRVVVVLLPRQYAGEATLDVPDEHLDFAHQGAAVRRHCAYELSTHVVHTAYRDGRQDVVIGPRAAISVASAVSADIVIQDSSGRAIHSTRHVRATETREWAERIAALAVGSPLLKSLTDFYYEAVLDPDHEPVHLYATRDALSKAFGTATQARRALRIRECEWGELGRLADAVPLQQGRHAGKSAGQLRDAESYELDRARRIARMMICAYMTYLEQGTDSGSI